MRGNLHRSVASITLGKVTAFNVSFFGLIWPAAFDVLNYLIKFK